MLDRIVWSKDQILATALADVDNDGDLDLVATTNRQVLVVWRNTTDGFVRAHALGGPRRSPHTPGLRAVDIAPSAAQVSDEHRDHADLTPHTGLVVGVLATPYRGEPREQASAAPPPLHFGRAPPFAA